MYGNSKIVGDDHVAAMIRGIDVRGNMVTTLKSVANDYKRQAKLFAPKRTNKLAKSIRVANFVAVGKDTISTTVEASGDWKNPYALFPEDGTGIYGPKGEKITPKTGNMMVFDWNGKTVYTPYTKGQRAQRYMSMAFVVTSKSFLPLRMRELENDLLRS